MLRALGSLLLGVLVFCTLGCARRPNQVEFVIPNGFRGTIRIQPDDPRGTVLPKVNGCYIVRVPNSGFLGFKGDDPFESYLKTARFENRDDIWVSKWIDDKPHKERVGLFGGITHKEMDRPQVYIWFVGTEEEWTKSNKDF